MRSASRIRVEVRDVAAGCGSGAPSLRTGGRWPMANEGRDGSPAGDPGVDPREARHDGLSCLEIPVAPSDLRPLTPTT
jgi:hypothetical protein